MRQENGTGPALSRRTKVVNRRKAVIRVSCFVIRDPKTQAGGTAFA